jgi:hypothetical protein
MANNNKNATLKPRSINLLDIQEELFSPEPTLAAGDPESLGGGVVVNYTGYQKCFMTPCIKMFYSALLVSPSIFPSLSTHCELIRA